MVSKLEGRDGSNLLITCHPLKRLFRLDDSTIAPAFGSKYPLLTM